jgi:hypothetical protein
MWIDRSKDPCTQAHIQIHIVYTIHTHTHTHLFHGLDRVIGKDHIYVVQDPLDCVCVCVCACM